MVLSIDVFKDRDEVLSAKELTSRIECDDVDALKSKLGYYMKENFDLKSEKMALVRENLKLRDKVKSLEA